MSEIIIIIVIVAVILLFRLFGAWMLRIDEVIKLQKQILEEMRKINQH